MGFKSKLLQLVMMMISGGVDCDGDGVEDDDDVEDEMEVDVNDGCDNSQSDGVEKMQPLSYSQYHNCNCNCNW